MPSYCNCPFNMPSITMQLIAFNKKFNCNCWNSLHDVGLQLKDGVLTCN